MAKIASGPVFRRIGGGGKATSERLRERSCRPLSNASPRRQGLETLLQRKNPEEGICRPFPARRLCLIGGDRRGLRTEASWTCERPK